MLLIHCNCISFISTAHHYIWPAITEKQAIIVITWAHRNVLSGPLSCHNGHNGKMHYSVGYGIAVQFPFNGQFEFVKITLGYLEVLQKMVRLFNLNPYCPVAALEGR